MAVVGFNFNKINIEKKKGQKAAKVSVSNNVQITNVATTDIALGKAKQPGISLSFEFTSKYEPPIGEIVMTGDILHLMDNQKGVDDLVKQWKKNKTLPSELSAEAINTVLVRCNIEALLLSRDINLPPPIPLVMPDIRQRTQPAQQTRK
jgi:hypothetical protein